MCWGLGIILPTPLSSACLVRQLKLRLLSSSAAYACFVLLQLTPASFFFSLRLLRSSSSVMMDPPASEICSATPPQISSSITLKTTNIDDLSEDLIDLILYYLDSTVDYIRFGAVCRKWRSVAQGQKTDRIFSTSFHHQPPMLILPCTNRSDHQRKVYNLCENKIHDHQIEIPIANRDRIFYSGSSFGWLAFAEHDFSITLMKPFTALTPIRLPPVMKFYSYRCYIPENIVYKVFLSNDPLLQPDDYVVAVIYGAGQLGAFMFSGDDAWTRISIDFGEICDMIFANGLLYVINIYQQLIAVDYYSYEPFDISVLRVDESVNYYMIGYPDALAKIVYLVSDPVEYGHKLFYLIYMGEELLCVCRNFRNRETGNFSESHHESSRTDDVDSDSELSLDDNGEDYLGSVTVGFKLYKLHTSKWVEIQDIGNHVLFLGGGSSISISSAGFPSLRPNSIYYTDDWFYRAPNEKYIVDMGIFDLEKKTIDRLFSFPRDDSLMDLLPYSIWILPTL